MERKYRKNHCQHLQNIDKLKPHRYRGQFPEEGYVDSFLLEASRGRRRRGDITPGGMEYLPVVMRGQPAGHLRS
jgi:hypothetical protein